MSHHIMQGDDQIFRRNEILVFRTTVQAVLYDVINDVTQKKRIWDIVVTSWTDVFTVFVVWLIPNNMFHYIRKYIQCKDHKNYDLMYI